MSIPLVLAAVHAPPRLFRKPVCRLVLIHIASFSNSGGFCFAPNSHIAEHCGLSRSTVQKAIALLVQDGWLSRDTDGTWRMKRKDLHLQQPVKTEP